MAVKPIENLEELIKDKVNGKVVGQDVTRLTEPGENYLSIVLKVDIKIQDENGKEITIPAVAKVLPPSPQNNGKAPPMGEMNTITFKNEIAWYSEIIPSLVRFQKERVTDTNFADIFTTMYGGRISVDPEKNTADEGAVVLLKNLKVEGYENEDRFTGMDLITAKATLRALATFHAVPIALKLTDKERYEREVTSRVSTFAPPKNTPPSQEGGDHGPPFMELEKKMIKKLIKEDDECALLWPRIKDYLDVEFPFKSNAREPWATLAHGDFWVNNIMVKHDNGNTEVKIVDLQMTPYKSALSDLVFFLFTSVITDILKDHLDELIKYYYEQFIENLRKLKVDTGLFTYEGFLEEFVTELRESELRHAIGFMFIIFTPKDKAPEGFDFEAIFDRETIPVQKEKTWFVVKECAKRNWI